MLRKRYVHLLVAGSLLAASMGVRADESPVPNADYGVSTIWQLGGTGGWDYLALEPGSGRLFVSRGDRVDVVGPSTGRRIGTVPNTAGVHGIAFAPELKRGYTSNGRSNSVTAFDSDSLRVIQEAPVAGKKPDAILYEVQSQHVLTANGASNDINALDPTSLQVVGTVALPGPPEFMVSDDTGTVYVNIETDSGKLVALDARSLKIKATWSLPGCANPTGLAIDTAHRRLFSVCENGVMVVTDSGTGKQVARVAIGAGPDAAAFDADLGFVFSSNGADGTLTVIHQLTSDTYQVIATVQTQQGARTMVLDPASHRIYLPSARFGAAPAPTADQPHPRPSITPDSFVILVAEPK
jgi:DNA-binding beta-propeller fold protein YncE